MTHRLAPLGAALRAGALAAALAATTAVASPLEDAERAWAEGHREEAGRILREWTATSPAAASDPRALALLARTADDPAQAVGLWDQLLALSPPEELAEEAHWAKGMQAYSAGLYVAAAREFATVAAARAEAYPKGRALLWKGSAELAADQPDAALTTLREAERAAHGEDAASVQFVMAGVLYRLGQAGEALRRYERFEREHRDDGRAGAAARRTVECLRLLGREKEAAARAAHVEREYPGSFEATLAREAVRTRESEAPAPAGGGTGEPVRWIVQVAAMTDPANATRLASEVRARKLGDVRIERAEGPEGTVHRVLLGPFADEARARAAADSAALLGDLSPRVREEPAR